MISLIDNDSGNGQMADNLTKYSPTKILQGKTDYWDVEDWIQGVQTNIWKFKYEKKKKDQRSFIKRKEMVIWFV